MDWSECCVLLSNLRKFYTDDDLIEIGRSLFKRARVAASCMFMIGRLMTSPMGFFRWLNKPRDGAGNQLFACVTPTFREGLATHECEIDHLLLPDGYEGQLGFLPAHAGAASSRCRRAVRLRPRGCPARALRRTAAGITSGSPTAQRFFSRLAGHASPACSPRETRRASSRKANEDARRALRGARHRAHALERARVVLDTAYKVGQRIWAERNPAATADADRESARRDRSVLQGASVEVANREGQGRAIERATAGMATGETSLKLDLSSRAHLTGNIRVIGDVPEAAMLLDLLAPTVALALENAFSYRALETYRRRDSRSSSTSAPSSCASARDTLAGTVDQLRDARRARASGSSATSRTRSVRRCRS